MTGTVLILGASGRFGRTTAEAFWNAGWQVRVFDRATDDLMTAAKGADVIVNGWNPAYPDWARDVPGITRNVIAAARASGATVIFPGNVYVFGDGSEPVLGKTTPHRAANPLGRIRIEAERAYREAGIRVITLRCGDFIDSERSGNWFDSVITAKARKGIVVAPGDRRAPHAWAYLPDVARAAVALAGMRVKLAPYEEVPFPGYTLSLDQIAELTGQALGRPIRVRSFPWIALRLAAPVWPMGRGLLEMRYLWSMPHRLDGAKFDRLLPGFRPTDPLTAIASALGVGREGDVHPDQPVTRGRLDIAAE